MDGSGDNELVKRVLKGETEAFRLLVDRHQSRIFYIGLRFMKSPEDAADFAQDVFLRAYERLRSFSGHVPFSAWLYRVAFNLAVNKYHVKKRVRNVSVEGLAVPDPRSAPDRELLRDELAQAVRDKVAELPRVYQVVLKMRFFEGLPYQRMARALRVPVNTAKSYVHRAKAILRQKLQAYLDEPGRMS